MAKSLIKVLGIDPGTHRMGWGVVTGSPREQQLLDSGCFEFKVGTEPAIYLPSIYNRLNELISKYSPDLLGIETLLFQKNAKTAITVAQARGVVLLASAKNNVRVIELAPNTIKSAVAGYGSAGKREVADMVGLLLKIDTKKLLDDTPDALAVALAAIVTYRLNT